MLVMVDSRLKQLKDCVHLLDGINVLLFGELLQLPAIRGYQVFEPEYSSSNTSMAKIRDSKVIICSWIN